MDEPLLTPTGSHARPHPKRGQTPFRVHDDGRGREPKRGLTPFKEFGPLVEPQRYERIAERLAADIRAGRLAPGARLPGERELARRLEVGRASVREAIGALQLRGVLETRPGSGSFVAADALERLAPGTELTAHDAGPFDLLEARLLLEPGVAALAAQRGRRDAEAERLLDAMDSAEAEGDRAGWNDGDRRFHRQLAWLTANPVLLGLADHVAALMDQPLWQRLRDDSIARPGRARIHAAEHRMIYEAIVDGDAAAASFYATQHLERVRRYMTTDQES
jgi:DNA-binding FadR family transcriptional regulator